MFHGEKDASKIDVRKAIKNLDCSRNSGATFSPYSRIVEREIEPTKMFEGAPNQRSYFGFLRNVSLNEQTVSTGFLNERNRFIALSLAPPCHDNVSASFSERDRCCASDTRGSAGD
jgi:hypothetical protein